MSSAPQLTDDATDDDSDDDLELLLENDLNCLTGSEVDDEDDYDASRHDMCSLSAGAVDFDFDESLQELFMSSATTLDRASKFVVTVDANFGDQATACAAVSPTCRATPSGGAAGSDEAGRAAVDTGKLLPSPRTVTTREEEVEEVVALLICAIEQMSYSWEGEALEAEHSAVPELGDTSSDSSQRRHDHFFEMILNRNSELSGNESSGPAVIHNAPAAPPSQCASSEVDFLSHAKDSIAQHSLAAMQRSEEVNQASRDEERAALAQDQQDRRERRVARDAQVASRQRSRHATSIQCMVRCRRARAVMDQRRDARRLRRAAEADALQRQRDADRQRAEEQEEAARNKQREAACEAENSAAMSREDDMSGRRREHCRLIAEQSQLAAEEARSAKLNVMRLAEEASRRQAAAAEQVERVAAAHGEQKGSSGGGDGGAVKQQTSLGLGPAASVSVAKGNRMNGWGGRLQSDRPALSLLLTGGDGDNAEEAPQAGRHAAAAPEEEGGAEGAAAVPAPAVDPAALEEIHDGSAALQAAWLGFVSLTHRRHAAHLVPPPLPAPHPPPLQLQSVLVQSWQAWRRLARRLDPQPPASSSAAEERQPRPGSLRSLDMCVEGLESLCFLSEQQYSDLDRLEVNVNRLNSLDGLGSLGSLRILSACDNQLSSLRGLECLSGLEVLRLDANKLCGLSELAALQHLMHLRANTNSIRELPVLRCSKLQKLELYHNHIESMPPGSLLLLTSLLSLDLGRNRLQAVSGVELSSCRLLEHLVLSQNRLREVPRFLWLPQLKCLWISGNKITSLGGWVSAVGEADCFLPMLEKLYLHDNALEALDATVAACLPRLELLDVSFNNIADANSLCCLRPCRALSVLSLQDNPFSSSLNTKSEAGLRRFIMNICPKLEELSGSPAAPPPLHPQHLQQAELHHMRLSRRRSGDWGNLCNVRKLTRRLRGPSDPSGPPLPLDHTEIAKLCNFTCGSSGGHNSSARLCSGLSALCADSRHSGSLAAALQQSRQDSTDVTEPASSSATREEAYVRHEKLCHAEALLLHEERPGGNKAEVVFTKLTPPARPASQQAAAAAVTGDTCFRAAARIQAWCRGRKARRQVKAALTCASYEDEELEEMFQVPAPPPYLRPAPSLTCTQDDINFDFSGDGIPELSDDWLTRRSSGSPGDAAALFLAPMTYGDHIRRRGAGLGSAGDEVPAAEGLGRQQQPRTTTTHVAVPIMAFGELHPHLERMPSDLGQATDALDSSRPSTGLTDRTQSSAVSSASYASRDRTVGDEDWAAKIMGAAESSRSKRSHQHPPAAAPKARVNANTNTVTSGTFGGKPKIFRTKRTAAAQLPAWISQQRAKENTEN